MSSLKEMAEGGADLGIRMCGKGEMYVDTEGNGV